jgi:bifunctional ADP-heptose synthase (sugar kinase/adenylyltransferase)
MRAASIVVGKLGVATATLDELRDNYLRVQP